MGQVVKKLVAVNVLGNNRSMVVRSGVLFVDSNRAWRARCCHTATSERRRIRLKADFHYFALRGASIRRSQRSNSEAVLFRWVLPRRYSIRRSQRGNNSATP